MKYSILGFNQAKIVEYSKNELKCDLTDLLLLNYIIYAQSNPKMKHTTDDEQRQYVWLQHEHILEDLPILNITSGTLRNRLTKLRKMDLIASKTIANETQQGSRTYYRITSFCYDLLFETASFKNDTESEPHHSKMTSNIKVNKDTKVNKVLSKDNTTDFSFGKQKPKKQNLFTKCVSLIDDFTRDTQIRIDLTDYLKVLLEMKQDGYNLYTNVWKGLLRKLDQLSTDPNIQHEIIRQSIERGYKSFFPVNNYSKSNDVTKNKPWEEGVRSSRYTEEELEELEELNRQREQAGMRTRF